MNDAEAREFADFLSDCTQVLWEQCTIPRMMFRLHHLYRVVPQVMGAPLHRGDGAKRFALGMLLKMARRRRRQLEERLAARN